MGRLICLSNRIPLGPTPSGGLVVALGDALTERGGIWIGTSGNVSDTPEQSLKEIEGGPFRRLCFDLSPEEQANYYHGYANSVLWPLFHGRTDLLDIRGEYLATYKETNRRLAKLLLAMLEPDDRIWVHDFHLLPLAYDLRQLGAKNRMGFFLHTPFPTPLALQALPNGAELCQWLAAYELVGLQAERDVKNCTDAMVEIGGASELSGGFVHLAPRQPRIAAFPIAIDARDFAELAAAEIDKLPAGIRKAERRLMVGVDRLDYTKGVPQRFRAFGEFLARQEDWHRHVSLIQISPPTREGVAAYDSIRAETESLSGPINGTYADITWAPIRFINRPVPREMLAGLYRAADIGLVTPLMDGMNLVAKEYVAAQDPANPGVLILSQFAGAAEQMGEALIVNPHDPEQMAGAMLTALTMPLAERRRRHEALMTTLSRRDVHWWSRGFLTALG
ncbi:trehalose-6-phosphate synthase [Rhodobacter xanthinilyticus]|uniref:Trehalose-6-phosphate synthase n=1 Tax=Rhodobacter xanthinilyticus TaxID=1850250 RepID=A0A1D9M8G2_9RHOB|nr:trehalose-6-phosphate synthase [Rhodobacter xanthinilyticus]AOZ68154.1 trehalose-6-phosphate synthase [Rhodobacter xanthinilyticus]